MDYRNYRLGNLLREVNSGKIVEVIGLRKFREERITPVSMPHEYYEKYTLEVSGRFEGEWQAEEINLTRYCLELLEFTLISGKQGFYYEKDKLQIAAIGSKLFFFNGVDSHESIEVSFLHQLQNLYFMQHYTELNVSALNPEPIPQP